MREMWTVMWTQPLAPIFQVFLGVRMGAGVGEIPIVLVHGYFQNRVDFLYLARRLRKAGSGPLFACNFSWPQSLERSSATVEQFVEWVCSETGAREVDLVTHSTGGLFALDLLVRRPGSIRRVAVIAIPGKGVPWRGPLIGSSGSQLRAGSSYQANRPSIVADTPVLSIYSVHDNVVHPASTSRLQDGLTENVEVEGPGHLSVLFDRRIADRVCDFLLTEDAPATRAGS